MKTGLRIAVAALALSWAAPSAAGDKGEVVDFTGEAGTVEPVSALPKADVEYQPMLPARYRKRRQQPEPVMGELEDPLPLKPQKRGCGACSTGGAPGPMAGLVALATLLLLRRRRRN